MTPGYIFPKDGSVDMINADDPAGPTLLEALTARAVKALLTLIIDDYRFMDEVTLLQMVPATVDFWGNMRGAPPLGSYVGDAWTYS